jgi:hypothetical protein
LLLHGESVHVGAQEDGFAGPVFEQGGEAVACGVLLLPS